MRRIAPLGAVVSIVLLLLAAPALAAPKARVTIFLFAAPGTPIEVKGQVSTLLSRALKKNPNLEVKDSDRLLIEFAGEVPAATIDQAKIAYKQGLDLLNEGRPAAAIPPLEEAVAQYEEVLPFIKKRRLAEAQMALGAAQAEARRPRVALATFERLLTWRPFITFDIKKLDPRHVPLFERARQQVEKRKRGSVELITDPPGARAFIDGRRVGITPTVAFGLIVGDHYATYKRAGFVKAAERITVSPKRQLKYTTALRRSEKYLLLEQSLASIQTELGATRATEDMVSLSTFLFVDQVVFVTIEPAANDQLTVQSYLYDLRSKLRLNQAKMTVGADEPKGLSRVAELLFTNVRYDGSLQAPPEPPPPPPPTRRPFYATWWFWTAVAVGTAGVVVPIVYWPEGEEWPSGRAVGVIRN